MRNYLLKRILLFVPTLLVISLVVFGLSKLIPGDPAERLTGVLSIEGDEHFDRRVADRYERTYRHLGLHLPLFYFSVHPRGRAANLRDIENDRLRKNAKYLMYESGRPEIVYRFYSHSRILRRAILFREANCLNLEFWRNFDYEITRIQSIGQLEYYVGQTRAHLPDKSCEILSDIENWMETSEDLISYERPFGWWMPTFSWHGAENQYHRWLADITSGNWGYSLRDGRPVGGKIKQSIGYTLILSFFSLLITFAVGIPLGLYLATGRRKGLKDILRKAVYALYAIPLFWLATLLVVFFTTDEYGSWTYIFPSPSQLMLQAMDGQSGFFHGFTFYLLPVLCLASGGIAFVARQMEQSAVRENSARYITMSRLKGNTEQTTIWRHLFPNSLFPLITLLGALIPGLVSGSVVIEVIFNIPGMGRLLWDSVFGQDWNTVFSILMIGALLTLAGQLVADILYAKTNPKVRYD